MNKTLRILLILVLAIVFVISGGMFARNTLRAAREDNANHALADQVHAIEAQQAPAETAGGPSGDATPAETSGEPSGETDGGVLPQFAALHDQNPDLAGWLTIPGTPVDYPVMYTPDDRDYYLRRAFDGSDAASGTLFIATPWTEGHTLVYGHHMKNGTMFGSLAEYADPAYWESHKTISFSTLYAQRTYEVMACFFAQAVVDEDNFLYWDYADLSDPDRFTDYVSQVEKAALYDTGLTASPGDELLTLSTCSYHVTDGRFVVVAKQVG